MKGKRNVTSFLAGVLVTLLVMSLASPSFAAQVAKTIQVYTGVAIYIDDVKLDPKDVNGDPVDVFLYDGTTYLPVRAVSEALGKTVQWEGATRSVYVGKHTGTKPAVWLENLDWFVDNGTTDGKELKVVTSPKDNLGQTYSHAVCAYGFDKVYMLNGQYSAISGTLFQTYEGRSSYDSSYIEIYGDGELLYRGEVARGEIPVDFNVDLTGVLCLNVKIWCNCYGSSYNSYESQFASSYYAAIANLGLWT